MKAKEFREQAEKSLFGMAQGWISELDKSKILIIFEVPAEILRFERYDKKAWDFDEIYPILRDFFGEREIVKILANGKGKPIGFVPVERFKVMSMTKQDEKWDAYPYTSHGQF